MCEQGMSSQRSWSELPMSALTRIFEELPLSDKAGILDCAARVCSSWAEAAAAATVTIKVKVERCSKTDSLQWWLHSRGSGVRIIAISKSSGIITSLPCPKLEDLELQDSSVDLRQGSQLLQDLCAATVLTRLRFFDVRFYGEPDLAAVLLALPNLKCFGLRNWHIETHIRVLQGPQQQLLHTSIAGEAQISHGTHQQLWSAHGNPVFGIKILTDSSMQFFCKLTKLQRLELGGMQGVTAAGLAGLANLPALNDLTLQELTCDISLSAVPALSQLTGLTGLMLSWMRDTSHEFDPFILAHMTQLELLELQKCTPACGTAGAAELLSRLSQLPQLSGLVLEWVEGLRECPPKAFSCLTSSSVLESLTFRVQLLDWDQPGPWQHMLPGTLNLSALTELHTADAMTWSPSDLDRLVSSCCHLQTLSLCCSEGLQLTPLLQLTALTKLLLTNATRPGYSTVASLAQLSALHGLQELTLRHPCCLLHDDFLWSLAALTQLTRFGLSDSDGVVSTAMQEQLWRQFHVEELDEPGKRCHIIINKAPDGAPPNVWSQLLSCVDACDYAGPDYGYTDYE